MRLNILIVFMLTLSSTCFGEWFLSKKTKQGGAGKCIVACNEDLIDDKAQYFTNGKFNCFVTETQFVRNQGSIIEIRYLGCWTDKTTNISVMLSCSHPYDLVENIQIKLQHLEKTYLPSLQCYKRQTKK